MTIIFRSEYVLVALLFLAISGCGPGKERWQKVEPAADASALAGIHRYERALFTMDTTRMDIEIQRLADTFPVFLGTGLPDSSGIVQLYQYINDPFIRELYRKTNEVFPDLSKQEKELNRAFALYRHYYPGLPDTRIFTYISGIDYQSAVIFHPPDLLIALDMYLGAGYEPYKQLGLPVYMIERFDKQYLVRDCMLEMAELHMSGLYPGDNVLEKMVYEGKKLFFLDAVLPDEPDPVKIGYTDDQWMWCVDNEQELWKFFIENQLLYATDIQVINKFFTDGPFTRGFPGSPSRLGAWLGWQIVRSYMRANPEKGLEDLLQEKDVQRILKASEYKPEKN